MAQTALVFGLDRCGRVRHSRELEFTNRADLLVKLRPVFDQHPLVEAWNGAVCVYRNRAAAPWAADDIEAS